MVGTDSVSPEGEAFLQSNHRKDKGPKVRGSGVFDEEQQEAWGPACQGGGEGRGGWKSFQPGLWLLL